MRRWTMVLVGAAALALAAFTVIAQPPEEGDRGPRRRGPERPAREGGFLGPRFPLMIALDADEDGEISEKEIEGAVEALKKLDKDDDGKLSREELRPEFPQGFRGPRGRGGPGAFGGFGGPGDFRGRGWVGRGPGARPRGGFSADRIMRLDADQDGKVTKEELPERFQRVLDRADANDDGAIDREEAEKLAAAMGRFQRQGPEGRPGGPPRPGDIIERVMRFDRNDDGKVTDDEMPEPMRERLLDRADADGDGAVDKEELEKMAEEIRSRGGRGGPGGGPGRPERPRRPAEE